MRMMLILAIAAATAVMLMASKCTVGDKTLPQKAPTGISQVR